jgi:bifunctional non-homologous end joining protein LigD
MPLDEYRRKRDFTSTPEPDGGAGTSTRAGEPLYFCVQKHLASHLHYDFRLEFDGVLLSWAVPKGPSIDPKDRRLAMQTEDHPLAYGEFEGVIPEGYGAGIVMLWDRGTWTPEVPDVAAALKKGDLKFRLEGFKLKGSWALVRTRGYGGGSKPSWLLIKHKDEWAGPIDIATFAPLSVKTPDADFADILASGNPAMWRSHRPAQGGDAGKMFERIIARALELKAQSAKTALAPEEPEAAPPADTPSEARPRPRKAAAASPPRRSAKATASRSAKAGSKKRVSTASARRSPRKPRP